MSIHRQADKLRVGIAGYGVVGKRRRQYIDQHPRLRTTAVCDQYFKKDGYLHDGVHFFSNYKPLLEEPLDVLFVCLPNYLAPEVTIAGLKRGLHVFCEKPPGCTIQDIKAVMAVEKEHPGLRLIYGFNHRYHDSVRDALQIVKSGELGTVMNLRGIYGKSKIISFSGGWRADRRFAGGGILLDQGIHMVDLMRLFAGEFSEVHSFISNSFWGYDVEDNAYALMRTDSGVVGMLHSSATQWRHHFHLYINLERGNLVLRGILSGSKSYGAETLTVVYADPDNDAGDPKEQITRYNRDPSWEDEISFFTECILNNQPVSSGSSFDAYRTMELVYRIYYTDPKWRKKYAIPDPSHNT